MESIEISHRSALSWIMQDYRISDPFGNTLLQFAAIFNAKVGPHADGAKTVLQNRNRKKKSKLALK
jgi:hypothetical protein